MPGRPALPSAVAPSLAGVYESDAHRPPVAPIGARAVETRDASGRVIGFGWSAPEFADTLPDVANGWAEMVTRVSYLRLVK